VQTAEFNFNENTAAGVLRTLEMDIRNQGGQGSAEAEAAAVALSVINRGLGQVFDNVQMEVESLSFGNVDPIFITLDVFELARYIYMYTCTSAILYCSFTINTYILHVYMYTHCMYSVLCMYILTVICYYYRHWAVFGYLIFNAIILILVALSVCFSACCRSPICMVM